MHEESTNVAEAIPYEDVDHMIKIIKKEHRKGRHVEVWGGYIYSAERWLRW